MEWGVATSHSTGKLVLLHHVRLETTGVFTNAGARASHDELRVSRRRVPEEGLPIPPLVERLRERDAAVDERLVVEEEELPVD